MDDRSLIAFTRQDKAQEGREEGGDITESEEEWGGGNK